MWKAAYEVQRLVFYAIAIIIPQYRRFSILKRVEEKLFKPMAWRVVFALLGALVFSMLAAPALASLFFQSGVKEWKNPIMGYLTARYRKAVTWTVRNRTLTVGAATILFALAMFLGFGEVIGSEFLPHLDAGAIWIPVTLPPPPPPPGSLRASHRAPQLLSSFPS